MLANLETDNGRGPRAVEAPVSQASAIFGRGGASLRLEAKLELLATLIRLAALLSRADLRIDIRTVLSIVSFW